MDRTWHFLGENGAAFALTIYVLVLTTIIGIFGVLWQDQVRATQKAERERQERIVASQQEQISQSRFLASLSGSSRQRCESELATLLALEALPKQARSPERPYTDEARWALALAMESDKLLAVLSGHRLWVSDVIWFEGGSQIVSVSGHTVYVWDASTGALREQLVHDADITDIKIMNMNTLVASTKSGSAYVWNLETFVQTDYFRASALGVKSALDETGGRLVIMSGEPVSFDIWDIKEKRALGRIENVGISSPRFEPHGHRMLTCGSDENAYLTDVSTGTAASPVERTFAEVA
jgi:WD40 repeat protein